MIKYILTAIYIVITTGGLVCLKIGGNSLGLSLKNGISFKLGYITCLGFILYIGSFLMWQKLLATYDLSYIVPITTGIVQVIILILSYVIFKENINTINLIGISLVIIGIVLISIKS